MRLIHISDTHGIFPRLYGQYDCVVHSGDFLPNTSNMSSGNKVQEAAYQLEWLQNNIHHMKQWLQGHTFLFTLGNHDFLNQDLMSQVLNSSGIKAISLQDSIVEFEKVKFYGFPYVPAINGSFNYEREIPEMQQEADKMLAKISAERADVLVCHSPLANMLDLYNGKHLGSSVLSDMLDYKLESNMQPNYYLCGHIHSSHGLAMRNNILVSNSATTQHIIELK